MKEQVNISNYEVYYLDFLEGNLDETSSLALQNFLAKHPELEIDADFEMLDFSDEKLTSDFKQQLRVFDSEEEISTENVESFMIAAHENLLSAKKSQKLMDFISHDETLKADFETYGKLKLMPENSLVFPNKSLLRQTRIIPMFIRFASIAAVFALIFTAYNLSQNNGTEMGSVLQSIRSKLDIPQHSTEKIDISNGSGTTASEGLESESVQLAISVPVLNTKSVSFVSSEDIATLKRKELKPFLAKNTNLVEVSYAYESPKSYDTEPKVILAIDQMKNPIEPITNGLSDILKQTVDFRTSQLDQDKKRKGFYLKIGKLEISRNTNAVVSSN